MCEMPVLSFSSATSVTAATPEVRKGYTEDGKCVEISVSIETSAVLRSRIACVGSLGSVVGVYVGVKEECSEKRIWVRRERCRVRRTRVARDW